jgi:hypothetical protein
MRDVHSRRSHSTWREFANIMKTQFLVVALVCCLVATTIALPIPENGENQNNSVGQHLGRAGLLVLTVAGLIGLGIGGITYGTNWWHRFKLMQAEQAGNRTIWDAEKARKEAEHQKSMEALDIILDVAKNYTDTIGIEKTEFDPLAIAKDMEKDVKDAQINAEDKTA